MTVIIFQKLWTVISGGSRRQKLRISQQITLIDRTGIAHTGIDPVGSVIIEGELWKAKSEAPIERGESVRVKGTEGVFVVVEPIR